MKKLSPNAATYTAVALIAIGLLMVFLGWNGAAGAEAARDLRAQFPYLLSGGIFGVALVGAGLVLVRTFEGRRDAKEIVAHLERLTLAVERIELAQQQRLLAEANARETGLDPALAAAPAPAVPTTYAPPAGPPAAPPFEAAR